MGIRLVVVDDNPHARLGRAGLPGRTPRSSGSWRRCWTCRASPVAVDHVVRAARATRTRAGARLPLDPRIRVVGTAPFDGIAGYLRHLPGDAAAPTGRRCAARSPAADLVWIKVPASNAALAGAIAGAGRRAALRVGGRERAAMSPPAGSTGPRGRRPGGRARLRRWSGGWPVSAAVGSSSARGWSTATGSSPAWSSHPRCATGGAALAAGRSATRIRLVWAGRLVAGKGLEALLEAVDGSIRRRDARHRRRRAGPRSAASRSPTRRAARDRVTWAGSHRRTGPRTSTACGRGRLRLPVARRGLPQGRPRRLRGRAAGGRDAGGRPGRAGRRRTSIEPIARPDAGRHRRGLAPAAARREPRRVVAQRRAGARVRGPAHATRRGRPPRRAAGDRGGRTCHGSAERVGSAGAPRDRLLDVERRARLGLRRLPGRGRRPGPRPTRRPRPPRPRHRP